MFSFTFIVSVSSSACTYYGLNVDTYAKGSDKYWHPIGH